MPRIGVAFLGALTAFFSSAVAQTASFKTLDELKTMPGFEKLVPKGRIAAIDTPEFVSAAEAALPDDAWVIGVSMDGVAKAYAINLLNRHEIVNDFIGDKPIATTW